MFIQFEIVKQRPDGPPLQAAFQVDLKPGQLTFLVGPPGSGKSTLLRILAGRQRADQGLIAVDRLIWFHRNGRGLIETLDRSVSTVFSEDTPSKQQTVHAVLAGALADLPPAARGRRLEELLKRSGMKRLANCKVMHLTAEQGWMLVLARAMAPRPRLLLLDEPFARLGSAQVKRLEAVLRDRAREEGIPVLISDAESRPLGHPGELILPMDGGRVKRAFTVPSSDVA